LGRSSQLTLGSNLDQASSQDPSLMAINDDIKSLRFIVKREFSAQNSINAEAIKNIAQLRTQNETLMSAIKEGNSANEIQAAKINESIQTMTQYAGALALFLALIFWALWSINQKLKKGIEIRLGNEGLAQKDKDKQSNESAIGGLLSKKNQTDEPELSAGPVEHGITADEFYKLINRQISSNTFDLKTSTPPTEEPNHSGQVDKLIKKRMEGFMRPSQPPKM